MAEKYIKRSLESVVIKAVSEFPAVVVTGPRQSGKTTMLKRLSRETYMYISLGSLDIRASALEDPRSFLSLYKPPVIMRNVRMLKNVGNLTLKTFRNDYSKMCSTGYFVHPGD